MKKFNAVCLYALATPALALAALSVSAQGQQSSTTTSGYESSSATQGQMTGDAKGSRMLSSKPAHGFHSEELIGTKLTTRGHRSDLMGERTSTETSEGEEVGTVSELVIDQNGQIVAVIVDTGGFLGMNKRSVAVSWDAITRTQNPDDDGYSLEVNLTEDALKEAPEYNND